MQVRILDLCFVKEFVSRM